MFEHGPVGVADRSHVLRFVAEATSTAGPGRYGARCQGPSCAEETFEVEEYVQCRVPRGGLMVVSGDDYEDLCRRWTEFTARRDLAIWINLGSFLRDRLGWHFEREENVIRWCFGLEGAARLVLTVSDGRLHFYNADTDSDVAKVVQIEDLDRWLKQNEGRYEGLTTLQIDNEADYIASHLDEWRDEQERPEDD
jgi:hypothetical protein